MFNKVSCLSIDIMNFDKPPASLAFLAGACESVNLEYQCISFNEYFLKFNKKYDNFYTKIKLQTLENLDNNEIDVINRIIHDILAFESDCIIISMFSFLQYKLTEIFLSELRKHTKAKICIGGPGLRDKLVNKTNGRILLEKNLVDYYCLDEGDLILPNFLKGNINQVGLNYDIDKPETSFPQIENLDEFYLLPSYKKINLVNYKNLENKQDTVFSISTSRGCVKKCSFCDVPYIWPKYRFRSGKNIANEIMKHHLEVGATHFTIVDSLINGSLKSFRDFNLEMINLKEKHKSLSNFSYNGMFIVRNKVSHDEDLFKNMKLAGCESIAIGVETGSDKLRFEMNKKFTNADLDFHLEMCQKYGIRNTFLMFVAYPTETKKDFEDTLKLLDRYQKYLIDDTIIGINFSGVFGLLNDTPVYNNAEKIGLVIDERYEDVHSTLRWNVTSNPTLTIKERIKRDLTFRKKAMELRYPIPYAYRYLEYLKHLDKNFLTATD